MVADSAVKRLPALHRRPPHRIGIAEIVDKERERERGGGRERERVRREGEIGDPRGRALIAAAITDLSSDQTTGNSTRA